MPDRDDKTLADNQVRLAVLDEPFAVEPGSPQNDEKDIVVDIQFGTLMRLIGVFDHQLVKPKLSLNLAKQGRIRLVQTEPHDPIPSARKRADFLDRAIADSPAVAVECAGDRPSSQISAASAGSSVSVKDPNPVRARVVSVERAAAPREARVDHEVDMGALRLRSRQEPLP